ncbi:hypothetical protein GPJ56_007970 [Histomonas meleagridis]|uniref:uncharacterized protein n=1 Tax=Histomonas meleagridis TaxID=135588 RepID=UPI00355A447C|nr:hypothetical protein GPJ56_007970 [Histomonas meleagridis]KAH0803912.1 hypothetical protein GO595_002742 [Histomonas meleagridis]
MIFLALFSTTQSICNVTIAEAHLHEINTYVMEEGQEICINATKILPLYVILYDLPQEANILYYQQTVANSTLDLRYEAKARDLPYVIRSLNPNSSFTIQAKISGNYTIGVIATNSCPDGIVITTNFNVSYKFSNSQWQEFSIGPGSNKCVLLMNMHNTKINVSLSLISNVDFLYYYQFLSEPENYTSNRNVTFEKKDPNHPMLFIVSISPLLLADRSAIFSIQSENTSFECHEMIYGEYSIHKPIVLPSPEAIIIYDSPVTLLIWFGVSSCIATILLVFSCIRYKWLPCCRKKKPLPPSSFVGNRNPASKN